MHINWILGLQIRCMRCGGKSERNERMMDLTVEIGGDIGTLEEALRQFTGTEILEGENKYQCSRLVNLAYSIITMKIFTVKPVTQTDQN